MALVQPIIAHENSVNTIAFSNDEAVFTTGGNDGSVRQFDMRNLQNSNIVYSSSNSVLKLY